MPCRRTYNNGCNIAAENKISMIRPVENKIKVVLGMGNDNATEVLKREPADAFEPAMKQ
jgi:hypothetical protein